MVNNTESNKLYEVIKQTLRNYEASYDEADWAQMQTLLDLAPKSNAFKLNHLLLSTSESLKTIPKSKTFKRIFSIYMLVGLAVLCGAYFLYIFINSPKTPDTINSKPEQKIETPISIEKPPVTPTISPVQDVPKPVDKIIESKKTDSIVPKIEKNIEKTTEPIITKKESNPIEKIETRQIMNIDTTFKNEPVATDTSHSSKTVLKKSKGKIQSVKGAKKSTATTSSDSLTKYLNRLPQDSLEIHK